MGYRRIAEGEKDTAIAVLGLGLRSRRATVEQDKALIQS